MQKKHDNGNKEEIKYSLYVLTDQDVEQIAVMIDSLYWAFIQLARERSIPVNYDPHALADKLHSISKTDTP